MTYPQIDAVPETSGKNGQRKKVFRALSVAPAGMVPDEVVDPVTAEKIAGAIAGCIP